MAFDAVRVREGGRHGRDTCKRPFSRSRRAPRRAAGVGRAKPRQALAHEADHAAHDAVGARNQGGLTDGNYWN